MSVKVFFGSTLVHEFLFGTSMLAGYIFLKNNLPSPSKVKWSTPMHINNPTPGLALSAGCQRNLSAEKEVMTDWIFVDNHLVKEQQTVFGDGNFAPRLLPKNLFVSSSMKILASRLFS